MGLALVVGLFLADGGDFGNLSLALTEAGLLAHVEPTLSDELAFSAEMFGYSGLHYVRRIAAYLALERAVPSPGDDIASSDSVVSKYNVEVFPKPLGCFSRLFMSSGGPSRLAFQHLMLHSDAEGFYVPQDFQSVIFPRDELEVPGGMIGSSHRLRAECQQLADWLEIPASLNHESEELWEVAESPSMDGPKSQQFGKESFGCLRLLRAAEYSVQSGAALVFC